MATKTMQRKTKQVNHKKKKKENNNDKNNKKKPVLTLEETIAQADQALEQLDVERAVTFYTSAATLLRSRLDNSDNCESDENNTAAEKQQQSQSQSQSQQNDGSSKHELVRVLTKLGETKVSLGDQDGACADFQSALELFLQQQHQPKSNNDSGVNNDNDDDDELFAKVAHHEQCASLHLYIGQLSVEEQALESYERGVEELQNALESARKAESNSTRIQQQNNYNNNNNNNKTSSMETEEGEEENLVDSLSKQLCKAHCTIAELFLTDLCFAPNAEQLCESHIEKAMAIDEGSIDALQTRTSLRLSQCRGLEGVNDILRVYNSEYMRVGCEALSNLVGLGIANNANTEEESPSSSTAAAAAATTTAIELLNVNAADNLPEFEFRCQTAKLLLECASVLSEQQDNNDEREQQCVTAAIQVLGSLMAENDEVVEVWYLLGCAFASNEQPDLANQYLSQAKTMLLKVQQDMKEEFEETQDEGLLCELQELETHLGNIESKMATLDNDDDNDNDQDDDDMETDE